MNVIRISDISELDNQVCDFIKNKIQTAISKQDFADVLSDTVKSHFEENHPSSDHFNPDKVQISDPNEISISVPGISRAYHDVDIVPVHAEALTIPISNSAKKHKASDFDDLFVVHKKNGKAFLARHNGGNLEMMYFLAQHVHQKQDTSLLPSDEDFVLRIAKSISSIEL